MHPYLTILTKSLRITIIISTAILLSHCATSLPEFQPPVEIRDLEISKVEQNGAPTKINAEELASDDINDNSIELERAEYYQQLADRQSAFNDQADSTLSAAEYYIQANDYNQAEQTVNELNISFLNPTQLNRFSVIKAYIDYSNGLYEESLQRLQNVLANNSTSLSNQKNKFFIENQTQLVDALLLSSFNYQQLNNLDEAISALIQRESLLSGSARAETSRYTWQIINKIDRQSRLVIIEQTKNLLVRNRLEQSLEGKFAKQTDLPPQFDQWRSASISQDNQTIKNDWHSGSPKKIAVLLPLNSRFSKAAHAVMDGIEYIHNSNASPYKPELDFFDIGANPFETSQYYSSIAKMGFDLIIGPIGKDYANQLFNSSVNDPNSNVPTILLGGDIDLSKQYNKTFTRLTISPEAEGIEVANHARNLGYITAAIIEPNTEKGRRTRQAFQQQWLTQGGNISKTITYSPSQYDHSVELKQMFDINQSQVRHKKISNVLGFKPEFTAYRRTDVDFIFMIADTDAGRILHPQINFFSGKTVPVYSTSDIFNGIQDEANNLDLEEVKFPIMPWILQSIDIAPYAGQLNMLFAIGSDAYQIAANHQSMANNPRLLINGSMGVLNIGETGDIFFKPIWAQFKNGLAESDSIIPALQDTNSLPRNLQQTSGPKSKSYNDSNWDSRRSSRKTSAAFP